MPVGEFLAGYTKAILRLALEAGDFGIIRRDLADGELSEEVRAMLFSGVLAFWATHGTAIDDSPGIGGNSTPSWHAVRELAHVRMRKKAAFAAGDWRTNLLRNRMTTDATAMRRVRIRWVLGQVAAEEFDV